jgi:ribosomally synthesized peptide (two-chain TOMM family)
MPNKNEIQDIMINPLMRLRLAYLRLIAESWGNDELRRQITKGTDIFPFLEKYGFISPWKHIELHLVDDGLWPTEWVPEETSGWIGSDDSFFINIPDKPSDEKQPVKALASYYQIFPTLFGLSYEKRNSSLDGALPLNLGVDSESFLEFGSVTLRAIALAWENDGFKTELTKQEGAKPALSRWLGYTAPWNFNIRFNVSNHFIWNGKTENANDPAMWTGIPKNIITLHYPVKPSDEKFHAIALTSYNNTGPAYPFSCA